MLSKFLKYQYKSRADLAPMIFVIFTVYHFFIPSADMSRIGIFFLQGLFYDVLRRSSINIMLVRTTVFPLRKLLWLHNAANFIWFNLWNLAAEIILMVFAHEAFGEALRHILRFEILLIASITVGNVISTSDYVTIKSKFWQYTAAIVVFTLAYLTVSFSVRIFWNLTHSYLLLMFFIMVMVLIWNMELKTERQIRFFKYLLK